MGDEFDRCFDAMIDDMGQALFGLNPKTCKHCGADELHWTPVESGYRLADSDDQLHECKEYTHAL